MQLRRGEPRERMVTRGPLALADRERQRRRPQRDNEKQPDNHGAPADRCDGFRHSHTSKNLVLPVR